MMKPIRYSKFNFYESYAYEIKNCCVVCRVHASLRRRHQTTLGDCNICHNIFPQKLGVIKDLKNQGRLAKKRVMDHCRGCHRNRVKQGQKAGPTSCRKCHSK